MFGATEITDAGVQAAASGSREDTARVLGAIQPQIRLMVAARLSPTPAQFHAAEDIAQQVSVGVTSGLNRLENRTLTGLKSYVSRIVANKVADYLRTHGAADGARANVRSLDSTVGGIAGAGPLWQLLSSGGTTPLSAVDRADRLRVVMLELGQLKAEHREVITLAFFDQLRTSEIAARLGISRPAASMLLIRAVKALRRYVTGSSEIRGASSDEA